MTSAYASGLSHATRATPQLAVDAVTQALERLDTTRAARVLLFLSADFAHDPRPALVAAARAAQTTAVAGCTALGVMNEDDWLLDTPAACALVLTDHSHLEDRRSERLTLAAPNTLETQWLQQEPIRYGGIAGDATGLGPYKVWQQGQIQSDGVCELPLTTRQIGISRGLQPIGDVHLVSAVDGFDLHTLDGRMAIATLRRLVLHLPPLHNIALAVLDTDNQLQHVLPIVSVNLDSGVTIPAQLNPGDKVQWMQRSADYALCEVSAFTRQPAPKAALLFSCAGRGAALHGGLDREWETLRDAWPDTPIAGFYGNGQIAHVGGGNQILHQSLVMAALG
ncbi:FIST C-terminal domain-containing protein [Chitinimonas sp. PSY-7]|uniref:FIST C-terminal domain-containing protein n=1 Tax=Chitinimonas sp. PSY-7 TaxID=3459088 RepID=UPI0040400F53